MSINSGQDKRTGQSKRRVRWRWSAPTFVRQSFVEHAQHSIGYCRWAVPTTKARKSRVRPARRSFDPWPSNGPASSIGAGKQGTATRNKDTSIRCEGGTHRCGKDSSESKAMPDDQAMQKNSYYFLTDHLSLLPCLASLLELQDVATLGSEISGLSNRTHKCDYECQGLSEQVSAPIPASPMNERAIRSGNYLRRLAP